MLALTQTSGYAVLALSCLDDPGGRWVLGREIVECTGLPGPYLSRVLHALSGAGLIETKRGYRGGYRLRRPAGAISVLEVVEAVDGPGCFEDCLLGLEQCSDERLCPTHEFWKAEKQRIRAFLAGLSLREVAAHEQRALGCRVWVAPQVAARGAEGSAAGGECCPSCQARPRRPRRRAADRHAGRAPGVRRVEPQPVVVGGRSTGAR